MLTLIHRQFIFDDPLPTPQCHASTIVRLSSGRLLAAWFAGTREGEPDTLIWLSRCENGVWSAPRPVTADAGVQHWNPVLFACNDDHIRLYYKAGTPISDWHTRIVESFDGGSNWTAPRELFPGDTSGGRGPVKNKILRLKSGRLLAPGSTEKQAWRCFADVSDDGGETWAKHPIPVTGEDAQRINMIQPTLWEHPEGCVHALMRSNQGRIWRSDSADGGLTWSPAYATELPNNNSGIDCVRMDSGKIVLVCNPGHEDWGARWPISVLESTDNGDTFRHVMDLDTQPNTSGYCYPAVIAHENRVHITYTWDRTRIVYCVLEENT